MKANPQVISVDKPGLKMRTMPVPLPFIGELRPSAASSGGYLFIATSDALIDEALAVKSGQKPGLKATDEFKHLAQGLPDQGNQFCYMSQRFAETLIKVQQQAMASSAKTEPQMAQWMQSFYRSRPAFAYSVGINTPEGCLTIGNGSQSYANAVLLPAVAVPGMLAAIAIPNFVKARATSQQNACINNLRQIDAAKNEWALEKGKKATDVPTMEDLKPYLAQNSPLPGRRHLYHQCGWRTAQVQHSRSQAALKYQAGIGWKSSKFAIADSSQQNLLCKFPARHALSVELSFPRHDAAAETGCHHHPRKRSRRTARGRVAAAARAKTVRHGHPAGSVSLQFLETARVARKVRLGRGLHL